MSQFILFMVFWILGIVAVLVGLYLWYTHWQQRKKAAAEAADPPPKPKMIQYHKLD
ncbi:MAG: hypothetical protein RRB13_04735 [bacterium]|nr:hypothetical protein [bacterium]